MEEEEDEEDKKREREYFCRRDSMTRLLKKNPKVEYLGAPFAGKAI